MYIPKWATNRHFAGKSSYARNSSAAHNSKSMIPYYRTRNEPSFRTKILLRNSSIPYKNKKQKPDSTDIIVPREARIFLLALRNTILQDNHEESVSSLRGIRALFRCATRERRIFTWHQGPPKKEHGEQSTNVVCKRVTSPTDASPTTGSLVASLLCTGDQTRPSDLTASGWRRRGVTRNRRERFLVPSHCKNARPPLSRITPTSGPHAIHEFFGREFHSRLFAARFLLFLRTARSPRANRTTFLYYCPLFPVNSVIRNVSVTRYVFLEDRHYCNLSPGNCRCLQAIVYRLRCE